MAHHIRAGSAPPPSGPSGHIRHVTTPNTGGQRGVTFKILVLGDSAVGKTCIIQRCVHGAKTVWSDVHATTVGVDMQKKEMHIDGELIKLQIWDTAGQERFRSIAANYYRGAHGVLVCYDCTRRDSFRNVKTWLESIAASASGDCELVLIANKVDLMEAAAARAAKRNQKRRHADVASGSKGDDEPDDDETADDAIDSSNFVYPEEGQELAAELNIPFFATSAFTGANIDAVFESLAKRMYENYKAKLPPSSGPGRPGAAGASSAKTIPNSSAAASATMPRHDWRREASQVDMHAVEERGIQLHKQHEAANSNCGC